MIASRFSEEDVLHPILSFHWLYRSTARVHNLVSQLCLPFNIFNPSNHFQNAQQKSNLITSYCSRTLMMLRNFRIHASVMWDIYFSSFAVAEKITCSSKMPLYIAGLLLPLMTSNQHFKTRKRGQINTTSFALPAAFDQPHT